MNNKYQIIEVIGEGAYGIVYKCKNKKTNEIVAIKKFLEEYDKLPKKEINREIYALQMSKHENIVKFIEAFLNKGYLYLVFEYAEKNLLQIIEENPKGLNPEQIRSFIYQICNAVSYLHKKNIIHRDIKPENILIKNNTQIELCDFGFARKMKINKENNNYEKMTDYMATRWYRAPELILSQGTYGPEIDFWSIGCIMGELSDGKPMFPGDNQINQLEYIIKLIGNLPEEQVKYFNNNPVFNVNKLLTVENPETLEKRYEKIMSSEAIDFMKGLLELDPKKRLNADTVFEHKYFECYNSQKYSDRNDNNLFFSLSIDNRRKIKIPSIKLFDKEKDSNVINIFRYKDESFISETNESTLSKKKLRNNDDNNDLIKSFQPRKKRHFRSDMFDFGKLYLNSLKEKNDEKNQIETENKNKTIENKEPDETNKTDNNNSRSNKSNLLYISPNGLNHKKSFSMIKKNNFSESSHKAIENRNIPSLTPIGLSQIKLNEKKNRDKKEQKKCNYFSLFNSLKIENNKIPFINQITHKSKKIILLPKYDKNKNHFINKRKYNNSVESNIIKNNNIRNNNYNYSMNNRKSIDYFTKEDQIIYEKDEFNSAKRIVNLYENSFKDFDINKKEKDKIIPKTTKRKSGIEIFFKNIEQKKLYNSPKKKLRLPPIFNFHNEIINSNKNGNKIKNNFQCNFKIINNRYKNDNI